MSQLLSPVYTEALKIQNTSLNLCSKSSWKKPDKVANPCTLVMQSGKRKECRRVRVSAEDSVSPIDSSADDYYAVLGLVNMHQILFFLSFPANSCKLIYDLIIYHREQYS